MQKIDTEFLALAYNEIPRLLGQLNRNPGSKTYGSFDRAYWHYRTNDISCCRYQEAVYTLALLYCTSFPGNEYYRDPQMLLWIRSALAFTPKLQRGNGSFDEWYIHEGSYVGTAFLTAALCQTVLLLESQSVSIPETKLIRVVIEKSARFLMSSEEKTVLNQMSGAIFALCAAGHILGDDSFKKTAHEFMQQFLALQQEEGWWSEYGGPDIGYLSLTISYLHKYALLAPSPEVDTALIKAKAFVEAFMHPDKTAGGEYMSRNTEYIIPSPVLPYVSAVTPHSLDDRYLCYILYNWLEAGLTATPEAMHKKVGLTYYPLSTLVRYVDDEVFFVANGLKGGAFRIYTKGKVYYDSGVEIQKMQKVFSTGILDAENHVTYSDATLTVSGTMKPIAEPLLSTPIMIPFKTWQFLFGYIGSAQKIIKKILRKRMVSYAGNSALRFERTLVCDRHTKKIIITDTLHTAVLSHDILYGVKAAYTAVPSSKYAPLPEINARIIEPKIEETVSDDSITIVRTFSW